MEVFAQHVRGSSLLLSGRFLAVGAKLVTQVLIVRYLSVSDYGAWAYALAVVAFLHHFASLSLGRSVSRFAAIYHQQERYDRFFGAILLTACVILVTGIIFFASLYIFVEELAALLDDETLPLLLLFTMIFLVPLEALDALLIAIFATFSRARAIFFRRYLLTPVLQLSVVLLLIFLEAGVAFLAYGYLVATLLGVGVSVWLFVSMLREQGLLAKVRLRGITLPSREMFSFSLPLTVEDGLAALMGSSGVLALGYFYGMEQVAMFRAVVPMAAQIHIVLDSFALLYQPAASRLFAKEDYRGINDLYWRMAVWIAVLSFPIFAILFAAATPVTVLLFGAPYEEAGMILAILAFGAYVEASMGFNRQTLRVLGKVRYIVVIDVIAGIVNIALIMALVPPFGAVGAAIAMSMSWVILNILRQIGLRMAAGFSLIDEKYIRSYAIITGGVAALMVVCLAGSDSTVLLVAAAAIVSLIVFTLTKRTLKIGDTFPELIKIPFLRAIVT